MDDVVALDGDSDRSCRSPASAEPLYHCGRKPGRGKYALRITEVDLIVACRQTGCQVTAVQAGVAEADRLSRVLAVDLNAAVRDRRPGRRPCRDDPGDRAA